MKREHWRAFSVLRWVAAGLLVASFASVQPSRAATLPRCYLKPRPTTFCGTWLCYRWAECSLGVHFPARKPGCVKWACGPRRVDHTALATGTSCLSPAERALGLSSACSPSN
jgi:hypothetical protein